LDLTITLAIVVVTVLISITGFSQQKVIDDLIFYPPAIVAQNQYFRFISHGFIHADVMHLAFNMFALYSFGNAVEDIFNLQCLFGSMGKLFFIILYFSSLVMASLPDYFKYRDSYHFRSLGASGAVSAVIFSSIILLPQIPIRLFFIPVDIPGYIFGLIYLAFSAYLDKKGGGNINHGAHLWGALYGLAFTIFFVMMFGKIDLWENFMRQIQSMGTILPFECDLQ
jgi:membrane associated rhomboid family serine protease